MSFLVRRAKIIDRPLVLELLGELFIIKKKENNFELLVYDSVKIFKNAKKSTNKLPNVI